MHSRYHRWKKSTDINVTMWCGMLSGLAHTYMQSVTFSGWLKHSCYQSDNLAVLSDLCDTCCAGSFVSRTLQWKVLTLVVGSHLTTAHKQLISCPCVFSLLTAASSQFEFPYLFVGVPVVSMPFVLGYDQVCGFG